jgi:RNA polymerase sigma-70 factor (ECF subfamily)
VRDTSNEDVRFAARLQARDGAALRELFEREGRRALGLAYRVLGDHAAAEDAVQEAFAQLWERADRLDPAGGRIESLLMTIVYRRAIDMARVRRNGASPLPPPDMLPQVDERAAVMLDRVLDLLSSDGLRRKLRAALDGLPDEQRRVVELAYFQGLTLREIADRDGVPLGTVKSRVRLAMAKLTEAMRTRAPS